MIMQKNKTKLMQDKKQVKQEFIKRMRLLISDLSEELEEIEEGESILSTESMVLMKEAACDLQNMQNTYRKYMYALVDLKKKEQRM